MGFRGDTSDETRLFTTAQTTIHQISASISGDITETCGALHSAPQARTWFPEMFYDATATHVDAVIRI